MSVWCSAYSKEIDNSCFTTDYLSRPG